MERPTSVTVFGILNIVFAVIGVFGLFATAALFLTTGGSNNPVIKIIQGQPIYAAFMELSIPLGVLSSGALLASGIGLLLLKRWARIMSIGYAIYAIVFGIVGSIMNFLFLVRPMIEEANQKQGPEAAGAMGGAIGGTIGGCCGLIYPILILIFLPRPKVVSAFQSPAGPPPMPPN